MEFYGRSNDNLCSILNEYYNKQLQHYLHDYMGIIDEKKFFDGKFHPNANEKAQILLRSIFEPNNPEFQEECKVIENEIGKTTMEIFWRYNSIIMKTIGKIAECVIIDHCNNNRECNRKLINLAMLKENINIFDDNIEYDKYMAFSTSYKYTFKVDEDGFLNAYKGEKYSPCETKMDIGWCLQNDLAVCLMAPFFEGNKNIKLDYAHLQVKATTNCQRLDLNNYSLTPVVVFDLDNQIEILRKRYPLFCIVSAREIEPEIQKELEGYYKRLLGYAAGIINKLNVGYDDLYTNRTFEYLYNMSIEEILGKRLLGIKRSNVIELIAERNEGKKIKRITLPL